MSEASSKKIDVQNKVALITGAARGIGLAIAKALLKNGARVSIVDLNEKTGLAACTELQKEYFTKSVMFTHCDVTKPDELRSAFARTKEEFGGIDIVCNNAGMLNEEQWRLLVDLLLCAVIEGTYLALEYMSTKKGGKGGIVINTASTAGIDPEKTFPVYAASKHGVVGFTRSLKDRSESDGVRINALCPGIVDTKMVKDWMGTLPEKIQAFLLTKMTSMETVVEGVLDLIADTSKSGAILMVTKEEGLKYVHT